MVVVVGRGIGIAHEVSPWAVKALGLDDGAVGEHGLPAGDAPLHTGLLPVFSHGQHPYTAGRREISGESHGCEVGKIGFVVNMATRCRSAPLWRPA